MVEKKNGFISSHRSMDFQILCEIYLKIDTSVYLLKRNLTKMIVFLVCLLPYELRLFRETASVSKGVVSNTKSCSTSLVYMSKLKSFSTAICSIFALLHSAALKLSKDLGFRLKYKL